VKAAPTITSDTEVGLRRHWNDRQKAVYRLADVTGLHWSAVAGGHGGPSPRPMVYGYVSCEGAQSGELAHSGVHGPCPHRIKACVVAKDNAAAVVRYVRQLADAAAVSRRTP
jgi:hypothetical protein